VDKDIICDEYNHIVYVINDNLKTYIHRIIIIPDKTVFNTKLRIKTVHSRLIAWSAVDTVFFHVKQLFRQICFAHYENRSTGISSFGTE